MDHGNRLLPLALLVLSCMFKRLPCHQYDDYISYYVGDCLRKGQRRNALGLGWICRLASCSSLQQVS